MKRTYKYALHPTKDQEEKIKNNIQAVNKIRNLYIEDRQNNTLISNRATELISHYSSIDPTINQDVDYSALMCALLDLIDTRGIVEKKRLKGYTTKVSSYLQQKYPNRNNKIFISKVGYVKFVEHVKIPPDAKIICYHVIHDSVNRYYVEIVFDNSKEAPSPIKINSVLGLDYSAKDLVVDSNGERHALEIPNHEENLKHIAELQKRRDKCEKNSYRYKAYTARINKIYKKETNFRLDYLHKLSREFADKYDCIAIENLSMREMAGNNHMGKSVSNNSFYRFSNMLSYKLEERGKRLVKIDRYFPSSKTCSSCKRIRPKLELSERVWTCEYCGTIHDRDINAAINIKNEAERIIGNTLGERSARAQSE